jgi:mycoredoxin
MQDRITVYGASWCRDTNRTRHHLDELGVDYTFVDVDRDRDAAALVERANDGKRRMPTVAVGGTLDNAHGDVLSMPDNTELDAALARYGRLPHSDDGDGSPGIA